METDLSEHDKQQQQQRNREFMRRMLDMGMAPSDSYVEWRAQKQFELDCDNAAKPPIPPPPSIDSIKKRKF